MTLNLGINFRKLLLRVFTSHTQQPMSVKSVLILTPRMVLNRLMERQARPLCQGSLRLLLPGPLGKGAFCVWKQPSLPGRAL